MPYHLDTGDRPLIYCANPRTASTPVGNTIISMGGYLVAGHHVPPPCVHYDVVVVQTIRSHWEVLNSLWWKRMAYGDFDTFIRSIGTYPLAPVPMYPFRGITFSMRYETLDKDWEYACSLVGLEAEQIERTPTRTLQPASVTFQDKAHIRIVQDLYRNEMRSLNLPDRP